MPVGAFPEDEAKRRAVEIARRARAGEALAALGAELGSPLDPPLPPGATTNDALRDRFGVVVVQALARLAPGETGDPVRAMDGYWVVRLVAREPDVVPPLDEVAESVRQAWIQDDHDRQIQDRIAALRANAQVEIADPELAGARNRRPQAASRSIAASRTRPLFSAAGGSRRSQIRPTALRPRRT